MANPLKSLTPLGHDTPITETIGAVTITENTGTALASLASRLGREAEVASAAAAAGIALPGPGRSLSATIYAAIWLGPEQWMIEAPFTTHEDITAHLKPIFGEAASITDCRSVSGPASRRRLTMFSTPTMASSITTPNATASPPRVIVLIV